MYDQEDENWVMLVPFRVEMPCQNCDEGSFEYDPIDDYDIPGSRPSFRHVCNLCATVVELDSRYPRLDYMDAEDLDIEMGEN